jgi:hypothetical protein
VVLGGSIVAGEDSLEWTPADEVVFERLLSNGRALFGGKPAACKQ